MHNAQQRENQIKAKYISSELKGKKKTLKFYVILSCIKRSLIIKTLS